MEHLESFRAEVKEWLEENCPPSMRTGAKVDASRATDEVWGGRNAVYKNPESKLWLDRMGAKGWTMPTVAKEYGGGGLSKEETLKVAQKFAKALSKVDGVKVTVSKGHEEDSFDLDYDGEEYDGGSYNINDDGSVVNMALPGTPSYGMMDDDMKTIVNLIKMSKK